MNYQQQPQAGYRQPQHHGYPPQQQAVSFQQQQPPQPVGAFEYTEEVAALVPLGQYSVTFAGIERCDTEFGEKARLKWQVTAGDYINQTATCLCGLPKSKLTPKHTLHGFACAFLGRQPTEGETIDFNRFVGMPGVVIVGPTQTGGTKVTAFLPSQAPQQQPAPQVAQQPQQPMPQPQALPTQQAAVVEQTPQQALPQQPPDAQGMVTERI